MTDWWNSIEAGIQSALTYSEAKINSFFTGVESVETYVVNFFKNEGPILINDANDAKAGIDALAITFASVPEVTQVAAILDQAIMLFENLVTGLTQGATQGSPAAMAVSVPSSRDQLTALRNAQSALDIAKARAAQIIAKYGMQPKK